jgi:hypothetical protein
MLMHNFRRRRYIFYALILVVSFALPCWSGKGSQGSTQKQEFKIIKMGELMDGGVRFGITTYLARDGAGLNVIHGNLGSPANANEYFAKKISQAKKIFSQEVKRDGAGSSVGRRAEISFEAGESHEVASAVLWTDGQAFYEITALSLSDARKLEKQYNTPRN